jgi:hypothetical protein
MRKLPATFWERSLLTKPRDRDVVCHASAWDLDGKDDVRVKMCITPTAEDFRTIHHELGHLYYDLAYSKQSPVQERRQRRLPRSHRRHRGAVDHAGLPEAGRPDEDRAGSVAGHRPAAVRALQKVAFLPFAYMVDKWRWQVYGGQTKPADYDKAWWALKEQYQGVSRPAAMARRLRRRRQVPRRQRHPVRALLPGPRAAVPVPPRAVPRSRLHRPAEPLLGLRQQAKAGAKFQQMLEMGQQAMAGSAEGPA